jgi:hypothetical protein
MEKRLSVETAQEELNLINRNLDELEEALLGLIGEPSHVAEVLMGDMIKQAKHAQRIVDFAGYADEDSLLADFMQSKAGKKLAELHKRGKAGNEYAV